MYMYVFVIYYILSVYKTYIGFSYLKTYIKDKPTYNFLFASGPQY
jgi:hypothetical protein